MRILSSFVAVVVSLGLTADLSAQQKKSNNLGSMSARNAAAASGLAPKPNYNAANPFKAPTNKPSSGNLFGQSQNTARGNTFGQSQNTARGNMFGQPQNTARGNMAVRNPSTGKTQVFVPQNTASGKTIFKNPQTGGTVTSQGTARGGQILRGSNGTQTYIPPANTPSNSAKAANMQRFNEGKALYEKLHAQGRLPSQQQAVQPQFQQPTLPTIDFGASAEPTFEIPAFDAGNSAPSVMVQQQPVFESPVTSGIQAAPAVFDSPVFSTPAETENAIPFQGGSVTIANPAETRGAVKFSVDGTPVTLQQGMELTYDSQPSYVIEFTRGGGQGKARYTLSAGTNYNFSVSSSGWELAASAAPAPAELVIPDEFANAEKEAEAKKLLAAIVPPGGDAAPKFLELDKIDFNFAAPAEIVKGSRIVITSADTKLYDGSTPIATLKQFQSYTALDVTGTHVLIEHNGKQAWVKKADCGLGNVNGF